MNIAYLNILQYFFLTKGVLLISALSLPFPPSPFIFFSLRRGWQFLHSGLYYFQITLHVRGESQVTHYNKDLVVSHLCLWFLKYSGSYITSSISDEFPWKKQSLLSPYRIKINLAGWSYNLKLVNILLTVHIKNTELSSPSTIYPSLLTEMQ